MEITRESFDTWRAARADAPFTEWLRETTEPEWTEVVNHRFASELAAGTIDRDVLRRYLVQDYSFIDRFVSLAGMAIGRAPDLESRLPLVRFLAMICSDENTYFQRSFDALDVPERDRTAPELLPVTEDFHAIMAEAAEGASYAEALAALVVAEWSYRSWAIGVRGPRPADFTMAEWIELHDNPFFNGFVDWLKGQLDREGETLRGPAFDRTVSLFRRTVDLEKRFFDAAYG